MKKILPVVIAMLSIIGIYLFLNKPFLQNTYQNKPSLKTNLIPSASRPNFSLIPLTGNVILASQDNTIRLTYYYRDSKDTKGNLTFNYVDILNVKTNVMTTLPLLGPLPYARNSLFLSPKNNKLYFPHTLDNRGIYELWMSSIDGSNAVRIAGTEHEALMNNNKHIPISGNTQKIAYSPNGTTIAIGKILNGKAEIWTTDNLGNNGKEIFSMEGYDSVTSLDFEENGKYVVFVLKNSKESKKYRVEI